MSTLTADHLERSAAAILGQAAPADRFGTGICLTAARSACATGDLEVAGAMLDEAAARAGITGNGKLAHLHQERLAGRRQ